MTPARIIVGSGKAEPMQIQALAVALIDHAREIGFADAGLQRSRNARSSSCYCRLIDAGQRPWIVRVSNHRRPRRTGYAIPHFDLVSIDGVSGLEEAKAYIGRIARGKIEWRDPDTTKRPPRRRRRKRWRARA